MVASGGRFQFDLSNGKYTITSPSNTEKVFDLPPEHDHEAIRILTHKVEQFVLDQGGTIGQKNGARKKLTDNGYKITR
ncbi:hypothetical protein [Desulfoluna spongiiphila]|uniref:hypothetical protein n=1 Tax=Desulfoluna spongiiphila TaxID=419481 RepID=UPI00125EF1AA|nr:hypothetical protein [Desulfoluna spongiiphila]